MNRITLLVLFTIAVLPINAQKIYDYTVAPKDSTMNVYFDSTVYDPYQWMENPKDPRLLVWLEAQNKIIRKQSHQQIYKSTLRGQIASMYRNTKEEIRDDYEKKENKTEDKYDFDIDYRRIDKVPDLLYKKAGETNYRYLVKIKNFCKGKDDNVIITDNVIDPDQKFTAVEMSHNGSDWREVYFFDLESGKQLQDTLNYLRINSKIIWHENGVFYDRYNKPKKDRELLDKAKGQTLYYHKLGTSQSDDIKLYQNTDTTGTNFFRYFKQDSSKLFFYHNIKSRGKIYKAISFSEINKEKNIFLKSFLLYPNNDSINFSIEEFFGDTVILRTTWNAVNGKVMKADINQLNKTMELVPEFDSPLRSVNRLGKDKIACIYRNEGQYLVLIYNLKGTLLKSIDFPIGKRVQYFYENNPNAEFTDFCVSSFYHPDIWYQLSLKDLTFKPSKTIWVPYDPKTLETKYVKYKSKDGMLIPMYITCLKNIKLDGTNPTLLYGYGGYGITIEPEFDESNTLWLLHGGVLAIPDVRGGGVEGSDWEKSGRRLKKQNTIDDFISAAEYLIRENYTNPKKMAIKGGSHGGLLVGASAIKRPDLFKAVIAEAGIYDMLRFEKYTIGSTSLNASEFGTVTNKSDYLNLKSYSPLQNIRKGETYPNMLIITGDNDDRVPPFHSYKFIATLQERGNPRSLYQLYVVHGAGHSGALTPEDWTDKLLFEYYFLFDQFDIKFW